MVLRAIASAVAVVVLLAGCQGGSDASGASTTPLTITALPPADSAAPSGASSAAAAASSGAVAATVTGTGPARSAPASSSAAPAVTAEPTAAPTSNTSVPLTPPVVTSVTQCLSKLGITGASLPPGADAESVRKAFSDCLAKASAAIAPPS